MTEQQLPVAPSDHDVIDNAWPDPSKFTDVWALNLALPHLRAPFTSAAIRFKVQNVWKNKGGCIVVGYIDARLVIERLNAVVGGAWTAAYRPATDAKLMLCDLTVFGVTRTDVGGSPKGPSKDLVSDALKRAAVQFGVGVSVYALPQITFKLDAEKSQKFPSIELRGSGDRETIALTDAGHFGLARWYDEWLDATGAKLFGDPMDHGDVLGEAPGANDPDAASDAEEAAAAPVPPELTDDRAEELKAYAREWYATIKGLKGGSKAVPPGEFAGKLQSAYGSHETLEALVEELRATAGRLSGVGDGTVTG